MRLVAEELVVKDFLKRQQVLALLVLHSFHSIARYEMELLGVLDFVLLARSVPVLQPALAPVYYCIQAILVVLGLTRDRGQAALACSRHRFIVRARLVRSRLLVPRRYSGVEGHAGEVVVALPFLLLVLLLHELLYVLLRQRAGVSGNPVNHLFVLVFLVLLRHLLQAQPAPHVLRQII